MDTNTEIDDGFKMTEIGQLPEEWDVVEFTKSVLKRTIKAGKVKQRDYKSYGRFPIIDQGQDFIPGYWHKIEDVYQDSLPVIIFGDHTRIFKFVDFPFVRGGDGTKVLIPNTDKFNPTFLFFSLLNIDIPSRGYNRHFSILKEQKIPLPPLSEQKKITAVLSALQEAKEQTEDIIKATQELKRALMKHLFTYGPVPVDEAENVPLRETEIGMVLEEWELVNLKEVFEFSSKPRSLDISQYDKIPFIPMEYIPEEGIHAYQNDLKNPEEIKSGTFFLEGDLLVAKITPSFENGKQCIVDDLPTDFGYATTEVWPIHETELTNILYLFYYLKKTNIRVNIAGKMEGSTGRQRIPKNVLKNLKIPLPSLSIQEKIADILSMVDRKIEVEENKKKALEELFKSLLNNLMTGKIRVKNMGIV